MRPPAGALSGRVAAVAIAILILAAPGSAAASIFDVTGTGLRNAATARHLALQSSSPAAGETLGASPEELRLSFTEGVEGGLSSIVLIGPAGEVPLPLPTWGDEWRTATIRIGRALGRGLHTVRWQAVGRDGHPIRGEFEFTVMVPGPEAVSTTPPMPELPVQTAASSEGPEAGGGSGSIFYTAVRWFNYVAMAAVVGAVTLAYLVGRLRPQGVAAATRFLERIPGPLANFGTLAAAGLVLTLLLRLHAQAMAVFGMGVGVNRWTAILDTGWGSGWLVQLGGAVGAMVGFVLVRRIRGPGLVLGAMAVASVGIGQALTGHAAGRETARVLAISAQAVHVIATGVWLGTLLAILVVVVPALRRTEGDRALALREILTGFSRIALIAAGVVVGTGLTAAILQLGDLPALWTSLYGRILLAKLMFVAIVFALGALNWRSHRGVADIAPPAESALRRTGALELITAAVVVLVTAILVSVSPPDSGRATASQQASGAVVAN